MRICSPQAGLDPNATIGGAVFDKIILSGFADRGNGIDIILPKGATHPNHKNFHIHNVALSRGLRWPVSNALFQKKIDAVYSKNKFDALRIHSLLFTGLAAVRARNSYKIPVPIIAHHHHVDEHSLHNKIESFVAKAADLVITGSKHARETIALSYGIEKEKIAYVPYGIDESLMPEEKDEKLVKKYDLEGKTILLTVGSMIERKNPLLLVVLMRELVQKHKDLILLVRGDGPLFGEFKKKVKENKLEKYILDLPKFNEEDKNKILNLADVFVFPSSYEGFGFAVAEAMACGAPVVCFDTSSLPEIVEHEKSGLLAPLDDTAMFIKHTNKLIRQKKLRLQMGEAAHTRIKSTFHWDKAIDSMEKLYAEAIENYVS